MAARVLHTSYIHPSQEIIREAVEAIRRGGLVVGPTDTLYGIFADPFSREHVDKIYVAKKRSGKPIPVLASSTEKVIECTGAVWLERFMRAVWPGPVTIILPIKRCGVAENIHLGSGKVGFRVPAAPLPRLIAGENGGLITGTSANISGRQPPRTIREALAQLGETIDLYIDSGASPIGAASTVIEVSVNGLRVVREGAVSSKTITRLYTLLAGKASRPS